MQPCELRLPAHVTDETPEARVGGEPGRPAEESEPPTVVGPDGGPATNQGGAKKPISSYSLWIYYA